MLFKTARKMKNMSFSRSKKNQNVIFLHANIFQNLTCRKVFKSNSNALFFKIQNLTGCIFSFQNLTRCIFFNSKSVTYRKLQFKIMLFKTARKMKNMSFSRSKKNQNVIFLHANIFQNLTCRKVFKSNSNALFFKIQNLTGCIFSFQNLTRCENFKSKCDALSKFQFKNWQASKLSLPNLIFILFLRFWRRMISSVNAITNFFWSGELKDKACYRFSRQMDNWMLPRVNSSLNV